MCACTTTNTVTKNNARSRNCATPVNGRSFFFVAGLPIARPENGHEPLRHGECRYKDLAIAMSFVASTQSLIINLGNDFGGQQNRNRKF